MSTLPKMLIVTAIIGALNWDLIGFFNSNLVNPVFRGGSAEETRLRAASCMRWSASAACSHSRSSRGCTIAAIWATSVLPIVKHEIPRQRLADRLAHRMRAGGTHP